MDKILKKITFHSPLQSRKFIDEIAKFCGKKTKLLFAEELLKEWNAINSNTHQYFLDSDIYRVAQRMGLEVDHN